MEILSITLQLILSLSILVILHELGHFVPARLFKIRVEKFYLFFDAWFSLFKVKKGDTEYGIGWLPLGGYVKISGMIDESMDKDQMNEPPKDWEFRSKPAWQRLIVMIGGVVVNLVLGMLIYIFALWIWGDNYLPVKNANLGIYVDQKAPESFTLETGDKILTVEGEEIETFSEIQKAIIIDGAKIIKVERAGEIKEITLGESVATDLIGARISRVISPRMPFVLGDVSKKTNAGKAGLIEYDSIVNIDGKSTVLFDEVVAALQEKKGETVEIGYYRNGEKKITAVEVSDKGIIGVSAQGYERFFEIENKTYSFGAAIPAGIKRTFSTLGGYVKSLKLIFSKEGAQSLGGFGTLAGLFSPDWIWQQFWLTTAFLSIILAVMNILPIPALDGGHVLFLLYEMIAGQKPGQNFMEKAQIAGMILLFSLMIFANGNDIFRWITGG